LKEKRKELRQQYVKVCQHESQSTTKESNAKEGFKVDGFHCNDSKVAD
jgi:hypothetical protein